MSGGVFFGVFFEVAHLTSTSIFSGGTTLTVFLFWLLCLAPELSSGNREVDGSGAAELSRGNSDTFNCTGCLEFLGFSYKTILSIGHLEKDVGGCF